MFKQWSYSYCQFQLLVLCYVHKKLPSVFKIILQFLSQIQYMSHLFIFYTYIYIYFLPNKSYPSNLTYQPWLVQTENNNSELFITGLNCFQRAVKHFFLLNNIPEVYLLLVQTYVQYISYYNNLLWYFLKENKANCFCSSWNKFSSNKSEKFIALETDLAQHW